MTEQRFDLGLTGFDLDEIGKLLIDATDGLTDPDDVPEGGVALLGNVGNGFDWNSLTKHLVRGEYALGLGVMALVMMLIMSGATWYIMIVKFIDQSKLLKQARERLEPHGIVVIEVGGLRAAIDREFAALKPQTFVKVVESTTAPKSVVAGTILARAPGGGTEPLGRHLIEVPDELRDVTGKYAALRQAGNQVVVSLQTSTDGTGPLPDQLALVGTPTT